MDLAALVWVFLAMAAITAERRLQGEAGRQRLVELDD